jgi:crotonobetainyl-CoA:carnitine CoA-transferase CaiB-like acyl-CoA transferase
MAGPLDGLRVVELAHTPPAIQRPAPLLGQHTDEVLSEAGYGAPEIAQLREAVVVS